LTWAFCFRTWPGDHRGSYGGGREVAPADELIIVTALQRSFLPAPLGRIMGLVMLASAGAFPVSVALTTAVVHTAGAAAAFPLAGALTATAILYGLSRKAFRSFAAEPGA
jgi:hypothetical protein